MTLDQTIQTRMKAQHHPLLKKEKEKKEGGHVYCVAPPLLYNFKFGWLGPK